MGIFWSTTTAIWRARWWLFVGTAVVTTAYVLAVDTKEHAFTAAALWALVFDAIFLFILLRAVARLCMIAWRHRDEIADCIFKEW